MRVRLLSRASTLARLQTALVERALRAAHPSLAIECITRTSAGDQDQTSPLWKLPTKGAFTADLSEALSAGDADVVVHSYKDLPIDMPGGSVIAGALPRADARDLLLMRESAVDAQPAELRVLSSSPRRAWLLGETVPALLPWRVQKIDAVPVRGNIETRVRKLIQGDAHGLVIAKAALDRLLSAADFAGETSTLRAHLRDCRWMVMPMREFPWAPAQGAIAMEIAAAGEDVRTVIDAIVCRDTTAAVEEERSILAAHGGGCHQALGAAVISRPFGRVLSVRDKTSGESRWELRVTRPEFPRVAPDRIWPDGKVPGERLAIPASRPSTDGWWVARAEALPGDWQPSAGTLVWAAGAQTWRRLAERGVWVAGCADGLGDERPDVDVLAGRHVSWTRLTHAGVRDEDAIATYAVNVPMPDDLPARSHFFWTSGELFRTALKRWPSLRGAWHASGPGRTRDTILSELGDTSRYGVWLDRASWEKDVCL